MTCTVVYDKSVFFLRRASWKTSRERMCLGAMPGGVCCARWTQIDAIARADVPWRPLERRLPCQMICRKAPTLGPWWHSPNNRSPLQRTARVRGLVKGWSRNMLRRNQAKLTPTTAATLSTKTWVFMDKMAFRAVLSTESAIFMDKIESTRVSDLVTAKS